MQEIFTFFGGILTSLIAVVTIAKFLFYTKSEINAKFTEAKNESDNKDEKLLEKVTAVHNAIKEELGNTKDYIHKNLIEAERSSNHITQEFTNLLNAVKDELRTDNINRYNDLLKIINTKVSISDFDRLENKFDKVTETITELKTIVQIQLEENHKNLKKS